MLDGLEARMQGQQEALKHVESRLETAKEEAQRPFPQEDELKEKQVFITCCDEASVSALARGKVFTVKSGDVSEK